MRRLQLNLNLSGVIVIIAVGVLLPVMLATAAGIVALVLAEDAGGIITGVLVISFAVTAAGSALITVVLTGRKARLARRQEDFVASISHELRTPLSAIRLYTQTLQSGKLDADPARAAQCLETILREAEWLDVLVDRVLTWRASTRDQLPLHRVHAPVGAVIEGAAQRFRTLVVPDEMQFSCSVDSTLPVRHDPDALHAVVLNLLINAYKYTGVEKSIQLRVYDGEGEVILEVEDNGVGLSPVEARRIFQPFYRVGRRADRQTAGVGLGLSIAQYLVRQHKGRIDVRSEKGKGCTFVIHLPMAKESK